MYLEIKNGDKIYTCLKVLDIQHIIYNQRFEIRTHGLTEQTNLGCNIGWYQSRFEPSTIYINGYLGNKVKFWYNDTTGHHEEKEFDIRTEGDVMHLIQMVQMGLTMEIV
jgi:hypothetical protein